ncbi:hypothetical protein ANN_01283 [Periplaneta americana]|uniref:Uncharacterized protein n=1 Tax=Periplaneta americana TaxID=6978 RepID=A0ABQ8TT56_PERAM|nr:hypothetical protein ANN_01283 [Periplaneta americana]
MAGICEGGNEPPGSLKAISKSHYLRPPEVADPLDRPPWNVVQRCWMASVMTPEVDLLGAGVSPRTDRGGICRSRNGIWIQSLSQGAAARRRHLSVTHEPDKSISRVTPPRGWGRTVAYNEAADYGDKDSNRVNGLKIKLDTYCLSLSKNRRSMTGMKQPACSGRQHSLKWVKGIRSNIKCTVEQQAESDRAYPPAATVHYSGVSFPRNLEPQTFRDDPLNFELRSPNCGPLHSNSGLQAPQLRTQLKSRSGLEAGFTATQD